jgi:hypothetical protein
MNVQSYFVTSRTCLFATAVLAAATATAADQVSKTEQVRVVRLPDGAIQPQAATGADGTTHVIYFQGDPAAGDIFYARLAPDADGVGGGQLDRPLRVNSHPASAIAVGNVRGAHLALGRDDRIHVAWMGSANAEPKAPGNASPMLYTRLNEAGDAFEPERNVITSHVGLDGGGSLAADRDGNVYVVWHAPDLGQKGEEHRRVWVAASGDDGESFAPERAASNAETGCCGCCGMRALATGDGNLLILYRSAAEMVNRDMYLLTSRDRGRSFASERLDRWSVPACVMSTAALSPGAALPLAAWETEGQVHLATIDAARGQATRRVQPSGATGQRKHPVAAANARGEMLLAWTEGVGWAKGGQAAWQRFDKQGRPVPGASGSADGVPTWSLAAVVARPDGGFTLIY